MKRGGGVRTMRDPSGTGWHNEVFGRIRSRHRTQEAAEAAGRAIARALGVEHTCHCDDHVIIEARSYGNDPCPPHDGRPHEEE